MIIAIYASSLPARVPPATPYIYNVGQTNTHTILQYTTFKNLEEYTDLWLLVRRVQTVLQKAYPTTTAFNVAVQDGPAAGQSVPHVHVHILPRSNGSADVYNRDQRNDDIYQDLEVWSPRPASPAANTTTPPPTNDDKNTATASLAVPDDVARVDRTQQMMDEEAHFYRQLLTTP